MRAQLPHSFILKQKETDRSLNQSELSTLIVDIIFSCTFAKNSNLKQTPLTRESPKMKFSSILMIILISGR